MPNYRNSKPYTIRSVSRPDLIYVGSTTRRLSERFGEHKKSSNTCSSKQIIDIGDAYIELIENFPCDNKEQLLRREGELIRSMNCVNKVIAGRTRTEYRSDNAEVITIQKKQWRSDNAESISIKKKQYNADNKEAIAIQTKQYRSDNKEAIAIQKKQWQSDNADRLKIKSKQYHIDNKESINIKSNKYKYDNKEAIAIQVKQYRINTKKIRICVCGGKYNIGNKKDTQRHYTTDKHTTWVNNFHKRLHTQLNL
jgi:hypothetical protein